MKTETDIAFALLKAALNSGKADLPVLGAKQWWSLFRLMQQNHVAAMTADTMAALNVPREVKIPWLAEREKATRWARYQREVQEEIVSIMQQAGIETLVLKGTHTAQYYPNPELREFGDLDLYFYDKHDEADRIAAKELGVSIRNEAHHHTKYDYRGVTVESHYDFLNTHYPPSNRSYEKMLKELIDRGLAPVAEEKRMGQVPVPCHAFELLFLLRHMACHFAASRITLRDLVDWALTCRALKDKADWTLVDKSIKDYGMTDFVAVLNDIAERRLGISRDRGQAPVAEEKRKGQVPVPCHAAIERDMVYGDKATTDKGIDGLGRLSWKFRRWRALGWKREMVYNDSPLRLFLASLTSHAEKPQSILHKM